MAANYLRFGRGESLRSLEAKSEGKFPKTTFKKEYGITPKQWVQIEAIHTPTEWHHTGKYANRTYFYDPAEVKLAWIENYGYETLPGGLRGIETQELYWAKRQFKKLMIGGFNLVKRNKNHFSLAQGIYKLVNQCRFEEAGRLLKNSPTFIYLTTNIETGAISIQSKSVYGNFDAKSTFFPNTFMGL